MNDYLPFRGLSAWFSSSVRPALAKKWDHFGGCLATEERADYLFSDNSYSADTVRVYDTQPGVTVFQSVWVNEVLEKRCTVYDVPLGQYLVLPHYLVQVCINGDPFKTPEVGTLMQQLRGMEGSGPMAAVVPRVGTTVTSLSHLLARREERKSSQTNGGSRSCELLKNSREYQYQSEDTCERGEEEGEGKRGREEGGSEGDRPEGCQSGKRSDTVWTELIHCMNTTCLKDVRHIDMLEIANHKLIDFNPSLSHFTMKRK